MKGNTMRSTLFFVTLTLITGLAIGYFLGTRKSAGRLKECCPEKKKEDTSENMQASVDTVSV